jgi:hypothetical protein
LKCILFKAKIESIELLVSALNKENNQWIYEGKDTKSVVEDPKFVNPLQHDFRIQNKSMLKIFNFKPFDYTKAGVYGDEKWKKLAEFDPALAKAYDEAIEKLEKRTP